MFKKIAPICSYVVAAVGMAGASVAQAQATPAADGQWRGGGGLSVSATSGNTTASSVILNGEGYRATAADKLTLGGLVNYGKANGLATSQRWLGYGQYDWNLAPKWVAFGRLALEGDGLTDLDLRSLLAGGVGYKVIEATDMTFTLYGGVAYSIDRYGSPTLIAGSLDNTHSRISLYAAEESTHKLSSTVNFRQRLELYPGLSGDKAFLARFSAGLAVAMSSTMNLNVGLTHNFNSKPPAGLKKGDTVLFTGVSVTFGPK
ncbi:MAG: hypothetical protein AD742_10585 [Methylibium sp. NZG]|nr:MAG: hypothetical protein AD742_10585 [Methylibium sp. NZG]